MLDISLNDITIDETQVETLAYNVYEDIGQYIQGQAKEYAVWLVYRAFKRLGCNIVDLHDMIIRSNNTKDYKFEKLNKKLEV